MAAAFFVARLRRSGAGLVLLLTFLCPWPAPCRAAEPIRLAYAAEELPDLSLPELMGLEITSAARKEQTVASAAAAVFVIDREDIRRSGATSIPELLRLVPGLMVARVDANKWAVSARSFNSLVANKLLVLMDGRSVLDPIFSSTFWDVQDTLLEEIDRIEVIRGPAATLWGTNAINGVVNVVTRPARATQGTLLVAGGGSEERAFGAVRQGGRLGDETWWRAYAKAFDRDDFHGQGDRRAADGWHAVRGGFRLDHLPTGPDSLTLQGDLYSGRSGLTKTGFDGTSALPRLFEDEAEVAGAYLLGRWRRSLSDRSRLALQAYYDWNERQGVFVDAESRVVDLDLQHTLRLGRRQEIVWGASYRRTVSIFDSHPTIAFDPRRRIGQVYSLFLEDEIALVPERLSLTAGAKLEHNSFSGFALQPTLRLLWTPFGHHSFWGALSRASRAPDRFDQDSRILVPAGAGPLPIQGMLSGDDDFKAEIVTAFELGYRFHPPLPLAFDLAVFYNWYDRLRSFELGTPAVAADPPPTHLELPARLDNRLEGESWGVEAAAEWNPLPWLRWQAAYTFFGIDIRHEERSDDPFARIEEEKSPRHQGSLRTLLDLPAQVEGDLWLRYVDHLRREDIPGYLELDVRLGWKPRGDLELALVGQNLLDSRHPEFFRESVLGVLPTEVQRGVYARVDWRF